MAHIQEIMAAGISGTLARMIGSNRLRTIVAAGSSQEDAAPLIANFCLVAASAPGQGIRLNPAREAAITALFAIGPEAVRIYPAEDEALNDRAADEPVELDPGYALLGVPSRDHWLLALSAPGGGIAEAPGSAGPWARQNGDWVPVPVAEDAPQDHVLYARQDGLWEPVPAGSGGSAVQAITAGPGLLADGVAGETITTLGTLGLDIPVGVARGGTGETAPGGTALDNITGFTGTGYVQRIGAGLYALGPLPAPPVSVTAVTAGAGLTADGTAGGTITGSGTIALEVPVTVARGGTNATAAGGQALDNISGLAGTGMVQRTGPGAYSVVPLPALTANYLVEGNGPWPPKASAIWSEDAGGNLLTGRFNPVAAPGPAAGELVGIYIAGPDGAGGVPAPAVAGDGYGTAGIRLIGRRAAGTAAAPAALADGVTIANITARGHDGSAFGTADRALITLQAGQNWTPGGNATRMRFYATPIGSTVLTQAVGIQPDGTLYVGSSVSSTANNTGAGTVNAGDYYRNNLKVTPGSLQVVQTASANPAGTTSTTMVMMGLAAAITPQATTRILITITGDLFNASAVGNGAQAQIRYGSGSVPLNGDASAGNQAGPRVQYIAATTAQKAPFSLAAVVTGLVAGTPRWVDLSIAAIGAGTATAENVAITVVEL